ncbi:MAG TPA: YciI family protein [Natronosporangium sp.]|nr:YciI family protein [Natronosporangium sp.]
MRVMVFMLTTPQQEASGAAPAPEYFTEMAKFNEELVNAGVLLDGDGLRPSADGARLHFHRGETTVIDGPFTESKELVAGYWILQVGSKEEALAWAKRIPTPGPDIPMQVEVRPMVEPEDFEGIAPPEVLEQEERLRKQMTQQSQN